MNEEINQKAKQLVERFNNCNKAIGSFITEFQVKQCALIAVDEILKIDSLADKNLNYKEYNNENNRFQSYWIEVRQAIENL